MSVRRNKNGYISVGVHISLGFHVVFQRDPTLIYLLGRTVFLTQGCEGCLALRAKGQRPAGGGW